ncbi:intraflagellar transport protein 74 homolog isoform X2 [Paramacrobiotus metropolitanus]|nr:intraflagellar transport protein 74 homolog isoform X2 [Paramacrobiotus metropolitanus]
MQQGRPESAAVGRPGTASRLAAQAGNAVRPGTAARPGTARSSAGNEVRVQTGRLQSAKGRNKPRNNRDRPYFLAVLRSKITEITNEINKLNNACKEFSTLEDFYATYRSEHAALSKSVGELRTTQYNYESMLEAVAKGISDEEIRAEIDSHKQQNAALTGDVEDLLNQRQRRESELKKLQDKAHKYESAGETLLKEMNFGDQAKYREMQEELATLDEMEEKLVNQFEQLKNGDRAKIEEELVFSPLKKDASQALSRIRELQKTLDDVKIQISRTPEEEQSQLTEKLKVDNSEIASLQHQAETLQTLLASLKQQLGHEIPSITSQKVTDNELKGTDRQRFLTSFNEQFQAEENALKENEADVQSLLGRLSRNVAALNDLPIARETDILKSDKQFRSMVGQRRREQQLREDLLQMTFDENFRELKKLQMLFESLATEKEQSRNLAKKNKESEFSTNVSDMKEMISKRESELADEIRTLTQRKNLLSTELSVTEKDLSNKSAELQKSSEHSKISGLETQLQKIEAKSFDLQEVIADLATTASYGDLKKLVLSKVKDLNSVLIRLATMENSLRGEEE